MKHFEMSDGLFTFKAVSENIFTLFGFWFGFFMTLLIKLGKIRLLGR